MSDLAEFLLARIADDEEAARAATRGPWTVDDNGEVKVAGGDDAHGFPRYVTCDTEGLRASVDTEDAEHIARWDPARVLAEVEAKRRIVEFYGGPVGNMYVLKFLALPYADHPDYRQEWMP